MDTIKKIPDNTLSVGTFDGIEFFYNDCDSLRSCLPPDGNIDTLIFSVSDNLDDTDEIAAYLEQRSFKNLIEILSGENSISKKISNIDVKTAGNLDDAVSVAFEVTKCGRGCLFVPSASMYDVYVEKSMDGQYKEILAQMPERMESAAKEDLFMGMYPPQMLDTLESDGEVLMGMREDTTTLVRVCIENELVEDNEFRDACANNSELPTFCDSFDKLPKPYWRGREDLGELYEKAWEMAFENLRSTTKENGFVSNYIDTAFNDCLFMWDSCFILMFTKYAQRAFNFLGTLDNFYAKQYDDGFICREISTVTGADRYHRFEPISTGPNIFAWTEWEYYLNFGSKHRLKKVYPVLLAYHQWLKRYHTWIDGSYWTSGLGSGMDNQPRAMKDENKGFTNAHQVWCDTCMQQVLSAKLLKKMAAEIGETLPVEIDREIDTLSTYINTNLWDAMSAFYYDKWKTGELNMLKSVGAYWALLADIVPDERKERFISHLDNPAEFKTPHRIPSLSADSEDFVKIGAYWLGGVWSPTNYMVLRGLTQQGKDSLAFDIAKNHLNTVLDVYKKTGTFWENYSPVWSSEGKPSKEDFVGWTGLSPIAIYMEYVIGIRSDVPNNKIVWNINILEEHGIDNYPFGNDGVVSLRCKARSSDDDVPEIEIKSNIPLTIEIVYAGGSFKIEK